MQCWPMSAWGQGRLWPAGRWHSRSYRSSGNVSAFRHLRFVLVAVFAERESHAAYFLEQQGMSRYDAVNYISHGTTTRVLASLTPREERVLRMRFGIGMNTDHTLEEVGQQFSVTRERIRQIEAKALRKLKHPSRSRKLRSFLDS